MSKLENLMELTKINELLNKKDEDKKSNTLLWVLAIIGVVVVIAGIAYAVYRYVTPDYLEDFEDDFEDDFDDLEDDDDDDFFVDEGAN